MLCTSVVLLTSLLCYCRGSLLASDHDSSPSGHADPSAVLEQRFPLPGGWVCDHTCLPLQAQPVSLTHPQNRAPCSRPCFCAIVCGFPLPERNLPILSTQRTPLLSSRSTSLPAWHLLHLSLGSCVYSRLPRIIFFALLLLVHSHFGLWVSWELRLQLIYRVYQSICNILNVQIYLKDGRLGWRFIFRN